MKIKRIIAAIIIGILAGSAVSADTGYVNSKNGLCVRSFPDKSGDLISILPFGDAVQLIDGEDANEWSRIIFEGNKEAYVCSEYLQDTDPLAGMTYMGQWRITAYAYTGSPCANGQYPQTDYTIACNSLPFGTEVYISDVGFRIVEDRGPESMGSEWLDIYMGDVGQCVQWGDQYKDVYVVEEPE